MLKLYSGLGPDLVRAGVEEAHDPTEDSGCRDFAVPVLVPALSAQTVMSDQAGLTPNLTANGMESRGFQAIGWMTAE